MSSAKLCPHIGVGCVLSSFCLFPCPQNSYFCPVLASGCRFCPCPHFRQVLSSIFALALAHGNDIFDPSLVVPFLPLPPFPACFAINVCPCPCPLSCHFVSWQYRGQGQGQTLLAKYGGNGGKGKNEGKTINY